MTNFSHQQNLLDPRRIRPVVLIGGGSVGSFTALFLAKAGVPHITVYDHDTVASHNVPMSLYRDADVGRPKVEALREIVAFMTGVELTVVPERYTGQPIKRSSLIMCVDDMDNGRMIGWERVKREITLDVMIDTRTKEAYGEIYTVVPQNAEERESYENTLFPNSEIPVQQCGYHGIVYTSAGVAALAVASLCTFWQTGTHVWRFPFQYDRLRVVQ